MSMNAVVQHTEEQKAKLAAIPEDLQAAFTSAMDLESTFPAQAGYYDRPHGANVKLGMRWAKVNRLIKQHGLDSLKVMPVLARFYQSPGERGGL